MTEIAPAILTNDVSDFRKKYAELFAISHHFKKMHIDFIDGEFVHNKTVMPEDLGFLKSSPFTLVAHLMTFHPQIYFDDAKKSGFKYVVVHYEAFDKESEIEDAITKAKSLDLKIGLAINPETPLHQIGKFLTKVDLIQLMGVHPGSQGRDFIATTLDKVKELRALSKSAIIIVDGGVKIGIARALAKSGANVIVAGSVIFRGDDKEMAIEALKADIEI